MNDSEGVTLPCFVPGCPQMARGIFKVMIPNGRRPVGEPGTLEMNINLPCCSHHIEGLKASGWLSAKMRQRAVATAVKARMPLPDFTRALIAPMAFDSVEYRTKVAGFAEARRQAEASRKGRVLDVPKPQLIVPKKRS